MTIKNKPMTGPELLAFRQSLNLSVKDFWKRLGYTPNRGWAYEAGRNRVPGHVHRLVYLEYVLGIPTDPGSEDSVKFAEILRDNNPARLLELRKGLRILGATISELEK